MFFFCIILYAEYSSYKKCHHIFRLKLCDALIPNRKIFYKYVKRFEQQVLF